MHAILVIAAKEIQDRIRNRWILSVTLLLALFSSGLVYLGSTPAGAVAAGKLEVTIVSLSSLSIFLLPLIALILSHDAIVGERENGTLLLLLAYPISRWRLLLGKFVGHAGVVALATLIGYGAAGVVAAWSGDDATRAGWQAFAALLATSVLLGWVFVALATLISVIARDRGMAAAFAVGLWLLFVLLFDMVLLGLLAGGKEWIPPGIFPKLLFLNPTDLFRLFNLSGFENVRLFSGMAGLAGEANLPPAALLTALGLWILLPLLGAGWVFSKKEM